MEVAHAWKAMPRHQHSHIRKPLLLLMLSMPFLQYSFPTKKVLLKKCLEQAKKDFQSKILLRVFHIFPQNTRDKLISAPIFSGFSHLVDLDIRIYPLLKPNPIEVSMEHIKSNVGGL